MSESTTKSQFTNTTTTKKNGKRRTRAERGLPEDDALRKLARVYLETQRRLWPELKTISPYTKVADHDLDQMAEAFKEQFLDAKIGDFQVPRPSSATSGVGVSYLRYSCDNSNPRSLDDQLRLQLEKAQTRNEFIPWHYVFADASVTGTHSDRAGYMMAKKAIKGDDAVTTLYIDEIGRASRDAMEALKLGKFVKGLDKRILGVSDGFYSEEPFSNMKLHIFAMMNEWFVEQLRHKVNRGMKGAVARGTSIGKPALGYKLVPQRDDAGNPVFAADGAPVKTYTIDPETRPHVELAFKLYGEDHWSATKIAKHFNELQINDKKSWCGSGILQLLRRHLYVGIRAYNKTSMRNDPDTGKISVIQNDRGAWQVKRQRHLQIIPWKAWKKVQKRLIEARATSPSLGKKHGVRKKLFAKTLFDGTLVCGCCGRELNLRRSAGRHKQIGCPQGSEGRYDCTFKGSKSMRIIDQALLGYLRDNLLNAGHIQSLVERANHYLAEEARKPRADTTGLEQTLSELTARRDRLVDAIATGGAGEVEVVVNKLKDIEKQIKDAKTNLTMAQRANAVPPKPLNKEDVVQMLGIIDEILNQEPAAAAPVLREITGPITVNQKTVPGRKKPVWVATFGPNLVPLLSRTARENNYPDTSTWEYLCERRWIMSIEAEAELDETPKYVQRAPEVVHLVRELGLNFSQAAKVMGIYPTDARNAYKFGVLNLNQP